MALTVRAMTDLHAGMVDRLLLLTADSDSLPLVEGIHEHWPVVTIEVLAPPGRVQQARELCGRRHSVLRGEHGPTWYIPFPEKCVTDETGRMAARCPVPYIPR